MSRAVLTVVTVLSVVGCGAAESGGNGTPSGLASLGIDPLGRGDGIDITESDYTGRCYEDDDLEANRPTLPDPRQVAAEEAEAIARASDAAADAARAVRDDAEEAFANSFSTQTDRPDDMSLSNAGRAYLAALALASALAVDAYEVALVELAPEKPTTWGDLAENPNEAIQALVVAYLEELTALFETPNIVGLATDVIVESVKAEMLEYLKATRDAALAAYAAATDQVVPGSTEPMADPIPQLAFEDAQREYEAALAKSIVDGNAALDARIFAETAPSDLPPCDSEELRQSLADAFCTGAFVNPITPEEEAEIPGITARLDAYVARVCAALG